jgi:hypothetical protein
LWASGKERSGNKKNVGVFDGAFFNGMALPSVPVAVVQ